MIGEIIDSKYRIDRELGAGGMGHVYLATHLGTTRLVAVKVIAPKWARDAQFLARFQREAQACGRLRHPNIVNVTDFGIAKNGDVDIPYLVMEYLDGHTLSEYQKQNKSIPLTMVADILDQVALALADAHKLGIVHRDLKPDNIWLEPNGRGGFTIKVLDFGVAKMNAPGGWAVPDADSTPTLTNTGTMMQRTPGAMPPTFAAGTNVDEMETVAEPTPPPAPKPPPPRQSTVTSASSATAASRTRAEDLDTVAIASTPSQSSGLRSSSGSALIDSSAGAKTMPGSLLGTPAYMSPEQAFGREIDFRSDIYSLAVVAYSLVCGQLPFTGKPSELFEYHESGVPRPPREICTIPEDVSNAVLAGLARNPADRPASAIEFARRFHNAVDAEFLSLRRSKAFMLQHLMPFIVIVAPSYGIVVAIESLLLYFGNKLFGRPGMLLGILLTTGLLVFADNVIRAATAMMAVEEQISIRRFLGIRTLWKLIRKLPSLLKTQLEVAFHLGPGWIIGDCLWPTVFIVEGLRGAAAADRSRQLMTGLRSAGRALAIRHLALALLALAEVIQSAASYLRHFGEATTNTKVTIESVWFPWVALFAAAPLFLYDRTAASERGPLLQLDRTPEVRLTTRRLSVSSTVWLIGLVLAMFYGTIKALFFKGQ